MSETEQNGKKQKPRLCNLALWPIAFGSMFLCSLFVWLLNDNFGSIPSSLGILSYFLGIFCAVSVVCLPFGLILGIMAILRIQRSNGRLIGRSLAIVGLLVSSISLAVIGYIILHTLSDIHLLQTGRISRFNLRNIYKAMMTYCADYDGKYPAGNKWCDLLVEHADLPKDKLSVRSVESGTNIANYVMNKNVPKLGMKAPPDMVLVFETECQSKDEIGWNLYGVKEEFNIHLYGGKRCNILFKNGQIAFVKLKRVGDLKWEVEEDTNVENARIPANDEELKYWLKNMVWYHQFTNEEISAVTGLSENKIIATLKKFDIRQDNRPKREEDAPLLVMPYPGGRHPRIGFLDGAIDPQRETKFSVFTPWDANSYAVVDLPEAIWSNLGLTYLAHTHIDTIWTKQGIDLPKLEWNRHPDGTLDIERKLPNGIVFGAKVKPTKKTVRMELWLKNGTDQKLSDLRVQNCVMTKMAAGFEQQTNDNKVLTNPYVACQSNDSKRWIITAWENCNNPWANQRCPCFHSDPKFPVLEPGQTYRLHGWLSFYEGTDIKAEFKRIEATGWRKK